MTKFQIFAPNGAKACVIEADEIKNIQLSYEGVWSQVIFSNDEKVQELPIGWAAIPLDIIVKEEQKRVEKDYGLLQLCRKGAPKFSGTLWD
jgi:hypothetical protein